MLDSLVGLRLPQKDVAHRIRHTGICKTNPWRVTLRLDWCSMQYLCNRAKPIAQERTATPRPRIHVIIGRDVRSSMRRRMANNHGNLAECAPRV